MQTKRKKSDLLTTNLVALTIDKQGRIVLPEQWLESMELMDGDQLIAWFDRRKGIINLKEPRVEVFQTPKRVPKKPPAKRKRRASRGEYLEVPQAGVH